MPHIHLYVEMLVHLKQMALYASLQNPVNEDTKVLLSFDKETVTADHEGESASLYLPTKISGTANVRFPYDLRTEISIKLQIEDLHELAGMLEQSNSIEVPWNAPDLNSGTSIQCKSCGCVLMQPDKILVWKDLPNENWAELMDIWFCHKPHDEGTSTSDAAEAKGFSAKSRLASAAGTGFVDTVSFMMDPEDCQGIQVDSAGSTQATSLLSCEKCKAIIGSTNNSENDFRLYKSRLALTTDLGTQRFPTEVFLCAQLLRLVENSVNRKVVVYSKDRATTEGSLCWIFNPDIVYSSSDRDASAHRAMKILHKPVANPVQMLDENSNTLEELVVTPTDYDEMMQTLIESNTYLPSSARTFQEWQIGLLDRYEKEPSGCKAMTVNALNHADANKEPVIINDEERYLYM